MQSKVSVQLAVPYSSNCVHLWTEDVQIAGYNKITGGLYIKVPKNVLGK